jgi:hypothetical protein
LADLSQRVLRKIAVSLIAKRLLAPYRRVWKKVDKLALISEPKAA